MSGAVFSVGETLTELFNFQDCLHALEFNSLNQKLASCWPVEVSSALAPWAPKCWCYAEDAEDCVQIIDNTDEGGIS